MKYQLHAFMTIHSMIDNTRFQDSPLGELSDIGRTYALDKSYHTDPNYPDVRLVGFRSKTDDVNSDVPFDVSDLSIKLGAWLKRQADMKALSQEEVVVRQAILAEFRNRIKSVVLGKMVTVQDKYLPSFVEFEMETTNESDSKTVKIWFSDSAFKQQYPYYDIIVIPPVDNLDSFFQDYLSVRRLRNNLDLPAIDARATRLKDKSPYTKRASYSYDWIDPTDNSLTVDVPWTILIYGGIGENIELIKEAIVNHIMANTTHTREEWERIFPDLFSPNEYVIVPHWTEESVPGFRSIGSFYRPYIEYHRVYPLFIEAVPSYAKATTTERLTALPTLYKSLLLFVCGHEKNRIIPPKFSDSYPSYALIASRTEDFNRLDIKHQEFHLMLNGLLKMAEEFNENDEITDNRYTKVTRDGVTYISTVLHKAQWLCVTKSNYDRDILRGSRGF